MLIIQHCQTKRVNSRGNFAKAKILKRPVRVGDDTLEENEVGIAAGLESPSMLTNFNT